MQLFVLIRPDIEIFNIKYMHPYKLRIGQGFFPQAILPGKTMALPMRFLSELQVGLGWAFWIEYITIIDCSSYEI